MVLSIGRGFAAEQKHPPAAQQPDQAQGCGVKPEPEQKPAYLSDNSSKREKLVFPQDKQAYAAAQYPQDKHSSPAESAARDHAYPQDDSDFGGHGAFPQDGAMNLSGCPSEPSHTHS